ncbi:hypothetical protein BHK98_04050 [Hornefia porci]|uniref:DUF4342 domain-containing protein n=1 Tax=Hornefia porci TaxID=2652292 RepID=A0A1Q9JGJ1_9FIRM|nr:DUF4342 domain-containing protein [Hornefia porci]OLR55309.1 hypothetical protein BHK98_04050 [Hornefia porci]
MEITLEKIELVKDRTGVTYKEAKEALEKADGNVVEAIIAIEDNIDETSSSRKISAQGEEFLSKMKEVVHKGNVARIVVKRRGETILNIPLNAGVLGAIVAPWGIVIGVLAAFSFKCQVEMIKDNGEVVDISDKAGNLYDEAVSRGSGLYEGMKDKAPGVYETVKEKSGDVAGRARDMARDATDAARDMAQRIRGIGGGDDFVDIDVCDKDCESCEEPCEEPCDDCGFGEAHPKAAAAPKAEPEEPAGAADAVAADTAAAEAPKDAFEAAPETASEAAPETAPETVFETASEAAPETVPETVFETAPEPAPETASETVETAAREIPAEPADFPGVERTGGSVLDNTGEIDVAAAVDDNIPEVKDTLGEAMEKAEKAREEIQNESEKAEKTEETEDELNRFKFF